MGIFMVGISGAQGWLQWQGPIRWMLEQP